MLCLVKKNRTPETRRVPFGPKQLDPKQDMIMKSRCKERKANDTHRNGFQMYRDNLFNEAADKRKSVNLPSGAWFDLNQAAEVPLKFSSPATK